MYVKDALIIKSDKGGLQSLSSEKMEELPWRNTESGVTSLS
jgi:hypothetical protein